MPLERKIESGQIDALAKFSVDFSYEKIPAQVIDVAKRFIADTCAVAIAGRVAPSHEAIVKTAQQWNGGAAGNACIIGDAAIRLTPANAAFVNGYKAHCLEWDSLHEEAVAIAFCTPVGALLAECQDKEISGTRFLSAIVVATEFFIQLGLTSGSTARFFRPSAGGAISAALSVAHIRGYSHELTKRTIGLAYSLASGTMQAHWEGVATLAMQVGIAAKNAIYAADLAANGIEAPVDIFTGRFGFFPTFEEPGTIDEGLAQLGSVWHLPEVAYKPFPCGRATQGVLTILRGLKSTTQISPDAIQSIDVTAPPLISVLVNRPIQPEMSPSYARLCLQYIVALYLQYGEIDPRRFTGVTQPTKQDLAIAEKVKLSVDESLPTNILTPINVRVEMHDGTRHEETCVDVWGAPSSTFSDDDLMDKISRCLSLGDLKTDGANFFETFLQLEKSDDVASEIQQLYV